MLSPHPSVRRTNVQLNVASLERALEERTGRIVALEEAEDNLRHELHTVSAAAVESEGELELTRMKLQQAEVHVKTSAQQVRGLDEKARVYYVRVGGLDDNPESTSTTASQPGDTLLTRDFATGE